jgi:hypothetical protein
VRSVRTKQFCKQFDALPVAVQHEARAAYKEFVKDPWHPSLHLESVQGKRGRTYYSVRVGLHYRALAERLPDTWLWFWIGSHAEYDKLPA